MLPGSNCHESFLRPAFSFPLINWQGLVTHTQRGTRVEHRGGRNLEEPGRRGPPPGDKDHVSRVSHCPHRAEHAADTSGALQLAALRPHCPPCSPSRFCTAATSTHCFGPGRQLPPPSMPPTSSTLSLSRESPE